ncbi:hypothetical protein BGE01nite_00310 [Brevifollis gellanilyticus]|uniref:Uncharacterized protein n=1 Tax=Brevifollis gellanilyticus TaxID=748831 RepID=A0A512M1W6_9BACT|nr:hypothetical protein [Brevifollis gellanilyticus]GEP40740.1 hypothetical protein BGE01nite_00310 [Brevifollis gellanilyticus]
MIRPDDLQHGKSEIVQITPFSEEAEIEVTVTAKVIEVSLVRDDSEANWSVIIEQILPHRIRCDRGSLGSFIAELRDEAVSSAGMKPHHKDLRVQEVEEEPDRVCELRASGTTPKRQNGATSSHNLTIYTFVQLILWRNQSEAFNLRVTQ